MSSHGQAPRGRRQGLETDEEVLQGSWSSKHAFLEAQYRVEMVEHGYARNFVTILRNLALAIVLYGGIFTFIEFLQTGSFNSIAGLHPSNLRSHPSPSTSSDVVDTLRPVRGTEGVSASGIMVTVGSSKKRVVFNPHANIFNRPESLVVAKDDYLGHRPHVDTVANLTLLVEQCRGSLEGLEKMRNVFDCLQYLANDERDYYSLPAHGKRASDQDPQNSEYTLPIDHDPKLKSYVSPSSATFPSNSSIGTCAGPVIPYHVYWTGPATWRVQFFIKSYLYSQNLPCSRLWLWLDADRHPTAVDDMLHQDRNFARFLPFVERGDIVLKEWRFPSRIPLPGDLDNTDGFGYHKTRGVRNADGEMVVADGIIEDADGQQWLTLTAKQMTFLPVAVSDAVRFVVLHLHGGVYLDMDVILLRDMRPLLLPDPKTGQHAFAERWGAHSQPGDYNTAIMSLTANSSLSSYLLRGGIRMGLNFHPLVIGRMAWKDDRNQEFLMLETAAFDSVWTEFDWARVGRCTIPCFRDYSGPFKGKRNALIGEWDSYDGERAREVDLRKDETEESSEARSLYSQRRRRRKVHDGGASPSSEDETPQLSLSTMNHSEEEARLRAAGVIEEYVMEGDLFPPNNRTLEHFFRGAWSYHIHNQVCLGPQ